MSSISAELQHKLDHLPGQPGVYMFLEQGGRVLYVGKAKKLKNRVRSYFQESRGHDGKLRVMVGKIVDLEVIVTDSEAEALILENTLIKKHQPRYNVMYRDDKTYPYICVTAGDRPRVFPTRTLIKDGSRYYGPYDHVGKMKSMLEVIRQAFGLCTCACTPRMVDKTRGVPRWHSCFEEYFENCSGDLPADQYRDVMEKVVQLLNGKTTSLIRDLREEMGIAAQALRFEQAARLRDGIQALEKYSEKMKMVTSELIDRDLFAVEIDGIEATACGVEFRIREGKLVGRYHRFIRNIEGMSEGEVLQAFVEDYYTGDSAATTPDEVHLSAELPDAEPLIEYLWQEHGRKVPLLVPKIGEKAQLVRMAQANARLLLGQYILERQKAVRDHIPHSVQSLQRDLNLPTVPRRIECFDNSNLMGTDPVASMVCFVDGKPRKSEYKKFTIKTVTGPDDYASMQEVVYRRYSRLVREKQHLPDLIMVDGGKGQLSSAVAALRKAGIYGQVPVIGIAKRLEEVFLPGFSDPVMIPKTSSSLKLLQRLRDEAHRFAITYHREKRNKRTLSSELLNISGVGEATAKKLLETFGSVKRVRDAGREQLADAVGKGTAETVFRYFHGDEPAQPGPDGRAE
jgi:excinuclease ABC subunit C